MEEFEEEPDYTSVKYILQNLNSLRRGKMTKELSIFFDGRKEIVQTISSQICFYIYCLLKVFLEKQQTPNILVIGGSGNIASKVIAELTECGLTPLLSIYSRGDITAQSWRNKGYKSHHLINKLIHDNNPDIIISCISNSSFPQVCREFTQMMSKSTAYIYCALGLARRKVYFMFRNPGVFRSYAEPTYTLQRVQVYSCTF